MGASQGLEVFGVPLIGATEENAQKLLLTAIFIVLVILGARVLRWMASRLSGLGDKRAAFWSRQLVNIVAAGLLLLGVVSIWFDDPTRLTTAAGLATAGLAFALQRVITAVAGYFIILRGKTFNVGDRIVMGGVRGDVVALSFMQTTILEMGQPPAVQSAEPAMWVRARQYTCRVVTVSNAKVFDEPIYNFTRDFPYLWEEIAIPVRYGDDRARAEDILLDVAAKHTAALASIGDAALRELQRRYFLPTADARPRVYLRLTDNWTELTVRFIAHEHGVRDLKDRMSREILDRFDAAGLQIASATYEVVGLPRLRVEAVRRSTD